MTHFYASIRSQLRNKKLWILLFFYSLVVACGVKGVPLPPENPTPLGRGYSEEEQKNKNKAKTSLTRKKQIEKQEEEQEKEQEQKQELREENK